MFHLHLCSLFLITSFHESSSVAAADESSSCVFTDSKTGNVLNLTYESSHHNSQDYYSLSLPHCNNDASTSSNCTQEFRYIPCKNAFECYDPISNQTHKVSALSYNTATSSCAKYLDVFEHDAMTATLFQPALIDTSSNLNSDNSDSSQTSSNSDTSSDSSLNSNEPYWELTSTRGGVCAQPQESGSEANTSLHSRWSVKIEWHCCSAARAQDGSCSEGLTHVSEESCVATFVIHDARVCQYTQGSEDKKSDQTGGGTSSGSDSSSSSGSSSGSDDSVGIQFIIIFVCFVGVAAGAYAYRRYEKKRGPAAGRGGNKAVGSMYENLNAPHEEIGQVAGQSVQEIQEIVKK